MGCGAQGGGDGNHRWVREKYEETPVAMDTVSHNDLVALRDRMNILTQQLERVVVEIRAAGAELVHLRLELRSNGTHPGKPAAREPAAR